MSPDALLDQDFGLVADLIHGYAAERPQHPALIHDGRVLTYGELDSLMDRVAASLQRDGIEAGEVISICAASCVEYGAIFLGALRAGVAVAPLAPSSTPQALATMLADCGAKILFLDDAIGAALGGQELPAALRQVPMSMQGWLAPEGAQPQPVQIDPGAPFNIIYSSGTTGTPKGIVQSHRMRWAHVHRAALARYDRTAVTICSTPLYSNTTLVSFLPTLARGGTAVLMAKFDALKFLQLAQRHGATHAMLVPVQYQRIMDLPEFDGFDLSALPHEVLHQRAVRRGAESGHPETLARRTDRVLRHDRGRRQLHPLRARISGQTAHGRSAGAGTRDPSDRRAGPRGAARGDRRDRRPLAGFDDERLLQPAGQNLRGASGATATAIATSAPATSAGSTSRAFSRCSTAART